MTYLLGSGPDLAGGQTAGAPQAYYDLDRAERTVVLACYAPLLAWGPLLAAVSVSYHRRHRRRVDE